MPRCRRSRPARRPSARAPGARTTAARARTGRGRARARPRESRSPPGAWPPPRPWRPRFYIYNDAMISVRDGQSHILAQVGGAVPPETLPVTRALGRVLATDVQAPFDVPPADNSAVDGYAVGSGDIPAAGTRELTVVGDLAAGAVFDRPLGGGQALRIMTGAPMPAGADTVYA